MTKGQSQPRFQNKITSKLTTKLPSEVLKANQIMISPGLCTNVHVVLLAIPYQEEHVAQVVKCTMPDHWSNMQVILQQCKYGPVMHEKGASNPVDSHVVQIVLPLGSFTPHLRDQYFLMDLIAFLALNYLCSRNRLCFFQHQVQVGYQNKKERTSTNRLQWVREDFNFIFILFINLWADGFQS